MIDGRVIEDVKNQSFMKKIMTFWRRRKAPEDKVFWCIVPLFGCTGFVCTGISVLQLLKIPAVFSVFACAAFPVFLTVRCYRTGETQRCYRVFCLVENCALLPFAFVMNGGMHSGMPLYCLGGAILGAFCVTMKDRLITVMSAIMVYMNLLIDSTLHPDFINKLDVGIVEEDILIGFLFVSIGIVIVINSLLRGRIEHINRDVNVGIIEILGSVIGFRSGETGNHVKIIKDLMKILLEAANEVVEGHWYSEEEVNIIASAAVLHDIGKITIPDAILNKPGRLTEEEFEIVKRHPEEGCKIIEAMKEIQGTEYFCYSYEICRHHHEAYDGSGYPDGISGDNVPFIAQLASLADVYEALRSKRVYKDAYSTDEVHRIITIECKGKFSDDVINCYKYARRELDMLAIDLPENCVEKSLVGGFEDVK